MTLPPLTPNAWLRHDLIGQRLNGLSPASSILEVGSGGGAMAVRLARRFRYVGVEPDDRSYATAKRRLAALGSGVIYHGTTSALPPAARFDAVCAFEVLEHTEDDAATLQTWRGLLHPGGRLVISVPAYQRRFGPADELAGHYRRYEPGGLRQLLRAQGFTGVEVSTYGFPLGYALEAARNAAARRRRPTGPLSERTAASGRFLQPPEWLGSATKAATAPFRVAQRPFVNTGLGTGLVAAARVEA